MSIQAIQVNVEADLKSKSLVMLINLTTSQKISQ